MTRFFFLLLFLPLSPSWGDKGGQNTLAATKETPPRSAAISSVKKSSQKKPVCSAEGTNVLPKTPKIVFKKIFLGSDHAGFALKEILLKIIQENSWPYEDLGPFRGDLSVDYPDFAEPVARAVQKNEGTCGLLICGSGLGMSMAANRLPGIRAALCHETLSAQLTRQHNNANILVLGGALIGPKMAQACLTMFLTTDFEGGRHCARLEKLEQLPRSS